MKDQIAVVKGGAAYCQFGYRPVEFDDPVAGDILLADQKTHFPVQAGLKSGFVQLGK